MRFTARTVPLLRDNIDTDQIIPARYLTTVSREGLGQGLFAAWRYRADGSPNPEFCLNQDACRGAEVLVAGPNFGSGSSREHAVWALVDYGFKAVIAPSFADIFYSNSLKNRLLPIVIPEGVEVGGEVTVDVSTQTIYLPSGAHSFPMDPFRKRCFLENTDDLGYLLARSEAIARFENIRIST